jgi:hypothetical protein
MHIVISRGRGKSFFPLLTVASEAAATASTTTTRSKEEGKHQPD